MLSSQTCSNTSSMSKLERDLSLLNSDIDKLVLVYYELFYNSWHGVMALVFSLVYISV